MSVSCECCVVSATSWSLVQRSPTDCGVSQMCVTMKPRRNEKAQAHKAVEPLKTKKNPFYDEISIRCIKLTGSLHLQQQMLHFSQLQMHIPYLLQGFALRATTRRRRVTTEHDTDDM
jgi:hypothetical protein